MMPAMLTRSGNLKSCGRLRDFCPRPGRLLQAVAVALLPTVVGAIDSATLAFEAVAGDGWSARGVQVVLGLPGSDPALQGVRVTVQELVVAGVPDPLSNITVTCPAFRLERRRVSCQSAAIDAVLPALGRQRFQAGLHYELAGGALEATLSDLDVGGGKVNLHAALRDDAWQGELILKDVGIEALLAAAKAASIALPAITASGRVDLSAQGRGKGTEPAFIEFAATFTDLATGNEAGTFATDKLALALAGRIERKTGWNFTLEASSATGQAYAEPVFLDFGVHAIDVSAQGQWREDGRIELENFVVDHRDVVSGRGKALLDPAAESLLTDLDIGIDRLQFPGAYASYLQPFLLATGFKALETTGTLKGHVVITDGAPRLADIELAGLSADDGTGKLALYSLAGNLHWRGGSEDGTAAPSRLAWEGGLIFGLDLGAATLDFRTQQRDFELLEAARIPLLDGALELDRFEVRDAGLPAMTFALDANVQPISVQRLSRAFGWPEFGGQFAGRISDLRLDEGVLTLATTLRAQVFDGRLEVSDLKIEDPFGDWPRLYSSIDIYNLDLEQVTSAFSFGLITGRLSGYVNEMVLFNWEPVEFDLRLYTPPEDRSRHRISQRAVQNIGNLGGGGAGVGAALSSGFMSFFDEFNYDRLGISCRLENEVCLMDGVEPAANGGYYLVKGRGLPRIDVIGNAGRVDWPRLLAQLAAIAESEGPVVE